MATNYYKATHGSAAAHTLAHEIFLFADSDPDQARAALNGARAAFVGGDVSVWRRTAVVPGYIPQVGEMVGGKRDGTEGVGVDVGEMAAE